MKPVVGVVVGCVQDLNGATSLVGRLDGRGIEDEPANCCWRWCCNARECRRDKDGTRWECCAIALGTGFKDVCGARESRGRDN